LRTRSILAGVAAALGATAAATSGWAADRASAVIDCTATPEALVYDCLIKLTKAGTTAPLEQATVTVGADMPSMPMAHNVRPVTAEATGIPGEYRARLTLEMHGNWALRLKISGPLPDQLVEVRTFSKSGSAPSHGKRGHAH
jgi:hypothetical protein